MKIETLFVETSCAQDPMVNTFSSALGLTPVVVDDNTKIFEQIKSADDPWCAGKQVLLLTRNHGPFIRQCPGTREYTCCDYSILNIGNYCTMDCAYCILQGYFHPPVLQYFINHDALFHEIDTLFSDGQKGLRIGTGEFTDSLIWENWSDLTPKLIERFSRQMRSVLELKTKTTAIARLNDLDHQRKTIVSWSVNTPEVIAGQERGTATLGARLRAAATCQSWGYPLAFHFDPMIIYPGCEAAYEKVVQSIFDHVSAQNIVWISMGTLRFMPALQPIIQRRFPESTMVYGEFIPGLDGKMRYFKPLRIKLYKHMVDVIKRLAPDVTVYLCMEDDAVWSQSFGFIPEEHGGLPAMLDSAARRCCNLQP